MPNTPPHFDASGASYHEGPLADYRWDWGDDSNGTSGTSPTTTHTYSSTGTYTVTLTVTDSGGRTDMVSHDVTVAVLWLGP
mgnify:CR=1 FL=1